MMHKTRGTVSLLISFLGAALISTAAYPQWSTNPALNNAIGMGSGSSLEAVTDGSGGAILIWDVQGQGDRGTIVAQRINASGTVQWPGNGVVISTNENVEEFSSVSDGLGGAIITWPDAHDSVIYAQRINSSGEIQWAADAVQVCAAAGNRSGPVAVSDGLDGAIITWIDGRNGGRPDVYVQRINGSGEAEWTPSGVDIDTLTSSINQGPVIVSDGSGGAIITWIEDIALRTQRINASGAVQWTPNGLVISNRVGWSSYESFFGVTNDGLGGAMITWVGDSSGYAHIYAQRINASGAMQWNASGVDIRSVTSDEINPAIVSDGSGGAIITWEDYRNVAYYHYVYAQKIDSSGILQPTASDSAICSTCTSSDDMSSPRIVSDGSGGAIITWEDGRNGLDNEDIYAQRVDASGTVRWRGGGIAICTAPRDQMVPRIVSDCTGGAVIAWEDGRNGSGYDVYAQRVDELGNFYPEPWIARANDVANDQGGKIRVLWNASNLDKWTNTTITFYTVYMGEKSNGLLGKSSSPGKGTNKDKVSDEKIYWQPVDTLAANWSTGYSALVTTAADSGPQGTPWYYFQVIANSADHKTFWTSNIDSGYSVDNLPPGAPAALAADVNGDTVSLHWTAVRTPDLWGYQIYRSTSPIFALPSAVPCGTTVDTAYIDDEPITSSPSYYAVVAKDIHGNLSTLSNVVSILLTATDSKGQLPKRFALQQNYPNPFNPTTAISYQLPITSHVALKVYDIFGREVQTLVISNEKAGSYSVTFDGSKLASGVYFCRLIAGGSNGKEFVSTKKLVLVK